MSLLLKGTTTDDVMVVEGVYNLEVYPDMPTDDGVVVSELLTAPAQQRGKWFCLCVNTVTQEQYYEAVDRELTHEERVEVMLEEQQATIDALVLDSLTGGAGNV